MVFSIIGSIGGAYLCRKNDRFGLSSSVAIIRPNSRVVFAPYLLYFFKSGFVQQWVDGVKSGSAQGFLSLRMVKSIPVILPPLPLQTRIADLLSAYDELIEVNNRRIALLEQTAEQLYKEWFVRLRFPGYAQTKVRKGVPEGWSVKKLGDFVSNPRRSVKKEHLSEKDIYIGLEHLPVKSLTLRNWTTADTVNSNKLKFKKGEILFSKIRPYLHKVAIAPFDGICSTDTIILKTEAEKFKYYIPLLVNSTTFIDFASLTSKGTKMPRADWSVLKEFNLFDPTTDVIEQFNHQLKPISKTCDQLNRQNQTLRRTRDLLLPRLISGQLSVAEAETALNA